MARTTNPKATNSAATAQPSHGVLATSETTKFHAAAVTATDSSAPSNPQNQRAKRDGRRAASVAASCIARPLGASIAPGRSGTGGASAGPGPSLSISIITGPRRVSSAMGHLRIPDKIDVGQVLVVARPVRAVDLNKAVALVEPPRAGVGHKGI